MTSRTVGSVLAVLLPIAFATAQGASAGRLERVVVRDEMRRPGISSDQLVGRAFNGKKEAYASIGGDPRGLFFPFVFDEEDSKVFIVILGRKMTQDEKAAAAAEDRESDFMIVDALVLPKKKKFIVIDPLLTMRADGKGREWVRNRLGVSEYNKPQDIPYDRYVVPDYMFQFGDGSRKIHLLNRIDGRVYRDSNDQ